MVSLVASSVGPTLSPSETPLAGRRIAFTTPDAYAGRLTRLLHLRAACPLHIPTISLSPSPHTLQPYLLPSALDPISALAFTSRTGISALAAALPAADATPPLSDSGATFTVAALGKDAELLHESGFISKLCRNPSRIRVLVPEIASPAGLVESLGPGFGRRVLCPVPTVIDLEEPPVIPDFITELQAAGWTPIRVSAYETRWVGPDCVKGLVGMGGVVDAMVFTSTAEVEGLMKGLEVFGWDWRTVRERWPGMVVAAHGPVTAKGAERFGVVVDVVSARFSSFDGVLDALASWWEGSEV